MYGDSVLDVLTDAFADYNFSHFSIQNLALWLSCESDYDFVNMLIAMYKKRQIFLVLDIDSVRGEWLVCLPENHRDDYPLISDTTLSQYSDDGSA